MNKNFGFRGLYYFRHGWGGYAAFIVSALSTLTITYYLVIENIPALEFIFPTFLHYVIIISGIGIPILTLIGYIHWKKSGAIKAEIDISYEVNPYITRLLVDSELLIKLNLRLEKILKISENKNIPEEELNDWKDVQNEVVEFTKTRKFRSKDDWNYFKDKIK